MRLLFPWGLLALTLLIGVVLAYLLRLPRRRRPVPDLAPWLTISRADRRISNERRTLVSLGLQVAIVILLVLAYVKPYVTGGSEARHEIVLVDLSRPTRARDAVALKALQNQEQPKVSGRTRLEHEQAELLRLITGMSYDDRMTLIGVGARPAILASNEREPAILARRVNELQAQDEVADFRPACQLAVELARAVPHSHLTLLTGSTPQPEQFEPLADLPLEAGSVRHVSFCKAAENVGIAAFKSRKSLGSAADFHAMVTVVSSCSQSVKVQVELKLNDRTLDLKEVELPPGGTQTVSFSKPYRVGGVLKARLLVQDALAEDNEALDYLPAPRRMRVALITRTAMDEKQVNEYYLSKILRCDTGIEGVFLPADDYLKIAKDKNGLKAAMEAAVFDNWAPPADLLPPVHALFINAESPDIPGEVLKVLGERPVIRRWDEGHPLMNFLNLRDVFLKLAKEFRLGDSSTDVVAELVSSPLIVAKEFAHRKIAYVGFNPADSDIQFRKELPLLVFNCFEWFKRGPEPVTQIAPGQPMPLQVSDTSWKNLIVLPPGEGAMPQTIAIREGAESALLFETFRQGIYQYRGDNETAFKRGCAVFFGALWASNLAPSGELKIGRKDEKGQVVENRIAQDSGAQPGRGWLSGEWWVRFLWLALALLLAENYVFHRRIFF
ncbi:MAG TPA: BatA domain-containing protein [Planctomycetota bacterium]|jgi:hypothetical protein